MPVEIDSFWDFGSKLSERRPPDHTQKVTGDIASIVLTQIARTDSLRQDYKTTHKTLARLEQSTVVTGLGVSR